MPMPGDYPQPARATAAPKNIEWRLPRHARSVGRARTLFREQATSWKLPDEVTETVVLLLSELMTNAYRHAKVSPGREIWARCALDDDRILVWVTDANDALPSPGVPHCTMSQAGAWRWWPPWRTTGAQLLGSTAPERRSGSNSASLRGVALARRCQTSVPCLAAGHQLGHV